ncbi:MAG: amidase family protein [Rhodospirillaceae bacterium]
MARKIGRKCAGRSRRHVLKTAAWAAPVFLAAGPALLLNGCKKQERYTDMLELGARDAVARIQNGEMKAEAYVAQLLKHFNAHKDLNTVITLDETRVLENARAVDQSRAAGTKLGALSGLPFIVKDQIDVAGYPTTAGNAALMGYIPKQSATVVDAMIRAGGMVFAKANCAEMVGGVMTTGVTSSNRFFGFVRNPYDTARIPGGSSGGNGAAIAARIVPAGIGEDTGGSVRLPSAFCGIAGLRPSTYTIDNLLNGTARKRYSSAGIVPPASPLDTFGPMARTVADVAFLDSVITGETTLAVNLRDARVGIPRADYWANESIDPGVARAIQTAYVQLRDAGAQLVEIDFNALSQVTDVDLKVLLQLIAGGPAAAVRTPDNDLGEWLAKNAPGVTFKDINRFVDSFGDLAALPTMPETSLEARNEALKAVASQYVTTFQSNALTALAIPTVTILPPLINVNGDMPRQKIQVNGRLVDEFDTIVTNLFWGSRIGGPGLNVPAGLVSGLPVGLEILGLPGDDSQILGLGIAIENVLGHLPPPPFLRRNN